MTSWTPPFHPQHKKGDLGDLPLQKLGSYGISPWKMGHFWDLTTKPWEFYGDVNGTNHQTQGIFERDSLGMLWFNHQESGFNGIFMGMIWKYIGFHPESGQTIWSWGKNGVLSPMDGKFDAFQMNCDWPVTGFFFYPEFLDKPFFRTPKQQSLGCVFVGYCIPLELWSNW